MTKNDEWEKNVRQTVEELFDFSGNISCDGVSFFNKCKKCNKTFKSIGAASPSGICPSCKKENK